MISPELTKNVWKDFLNRDLLRNLFEYNHTILGPTLRHVYWVRTENPSTIKSRACLTPMGLRSITTN